MKWDYLAIHETEEEIAFSSLLNSRDLDPTTRLKVLASALNTSYKKDKEDRKKLCRRFVTDGRFRSESIEPQLKFMNDLGLGTPIMESPELLPPYSWSLSFRFRLAKPYLSKDDVPLYIIDNPVRKEKTFKVPMVASSQWKGALHAAFVQRLMRESQALDEEPFAERRLQMALLFGDEQGEAPEGTSGTAKYLDELKEEAASLYRKKLREHFNHTDQKTLPHHAGRLFFFPSYFNDIGMEIINPHDRKTKTGKVPIYIESVPAGAEAAFTLLYVAHDRIGAGEVSQRTHALADLRETMESLKEMFTLYGFGAKTSSGYGVAEEALCAPSALVLNAEEPGGGVESPHQEREPEVPESVKDYWKGHPEENFHLKPLAWKKAHGGAVDRYKEARKAYSDYTLALKTYKAAMEERAAEAETAEAKATEEFRAVTRRDFSGFTELERIAIDLERAFEGKRND